MKYLILVLIMSLTSEIQAQSNTGITTASDNDNSDWGTYTDPVSNVIYGYNTTNNYGQVCGGLWLDIDAYNPDEYTETYPGSPDAKAKVVILDKFTVEDKEYIVKSVSQWAFVNMDNIRYVFIPSTVQTIRWQAFYGCNSLSSLFLSEGIKSIEWEAFVACQFKELYLPEGLEMIESQAFINCSRLTSVTIPSSISNLGEGIFKRCDALRTVTSCIEEPFAIQNLFEDETLQEGTLRVPYGTKAKYEATAGWNQFKNIEEFIPTYFNPIVSEAKFWQLYESGESTFSSTTTWRTVSIDGKDYQQILHFNGKTVPDTLYFRGDNTRIYRYDANAKTEYTAYDFGLSLEDNFTGIDGIKMTVDKTWYENVNGRSLKHLHLVNKDNPQMQDTWVEGYGSIYTGLLNPTDWQDGVVQQHLLFDSSGYINIINTENLKTCLLEKEKIGGQIFEGNIPEKVISYSFDGNNLCLDGEMYLPASPCYAVCEVIGNTIDINLITIDDGAESSFTYKVHAVFPGFEAGTYTLTQNGKDPQTIICQPTSVESIKAGSDNTSIFDLTGRRLNSIPEKGMYIKGGRKGLRK